MLTLHKKIFATAVLLCASHSNGSIIAYEGFSYPSGQSLIGQSGGYGFSGAWNLLGGGTFTTDANGFSYPSMQTSGGSVDGSGTSTGFDRPLTAALGADNTTVYFSFLLQPQTSVYSGLALEGSVNGLFVGKDDSGEYEISDSSGGGRVSSGMSPTGGSVDLLVLKAQFLPGDDRFTLYVNPDLSAPEPATGTVKNDLDVGSLATVGMFSSGQFAVDEIKVSSSFSEIAVPEPTTSFALAGIASLASFRGGTRRSRRTSLFKSPS